MKKVIGIVMVVMMLLGLMVPVMASADTKTRSTMWVNCADGKRLNVRATPSVKADILYRVESGKEIEIVESCAAKGWLYVRQAGKACGYVMSRFLVSAKPGKYEVTERSDNFRSANYTVKAKALNGNTTKGVCLRVKPNKTSSSIRRLTAGDRLTVLAVGKTWSKVKDIATGRTGYVAHAYITRV